MKILFVVEHFFPYVGGAEKLFLSLARELLKEGHEVTVITTLHDFSLKKSEELHGIKIHRINCGNRFLFTIFSLPMVLKKAREADVIHTTSYNSAIPAFIAGKWCKKKVIITFHEVWRKLWFQLPYTPKWKLFLFNRFESLILKLPFHTYIAVSEFTRQSLITAGIPDKKIVRIYNGIDYEDHSVQHSPPAEFTFCFFGRLGISKGIDHLIDGAKLFFAAHPETKLKLIIPTYPKSLSAIVMQQIKKIGLQNNIILLRDLGNEKLLAEVSSSSCVIIPSYSEGFCFVAVESKAMNIPVISSGKGALKEVVTGKHLTLPELNARNIFLALEKAYRNDWEVTQKKEFPLYESIRQYLKLYESLL